jgi:4-amino-4-deoxy-L-arabinose transferase-like glycosyltransferase
MRLDGLELKVPGGLSADLIRSPDRTSSVTIVRQVWGYPILMAMILACGVWLRIALPAGFTGIGFDENLYRIYVTMLDEAGLRHYPGLIDRFIENQSEPKNIAILPPTRIGYIAGGYIYHRILGVTPIVALRVLSCQFGILAFMISALFCWRLARNRALTAAVTVLMACAPTQIHLGQHALIDGVFAFWALLVAWLLWENLQQPNSAWWQISYGIALAGMVMTKENAFFVFLVILGILGTNRWLHFGEVTRQLILATGLGCLGGLAIVIAAAGGIEQFFVVFALLKEKVPQLPYVLKTMGGPWHRYLVDLILVSPIILILALACFFQPACWRNAPQRYLAVFSFLTYVTLAAFPLGMNLRFIVMLDMPLRFLATTQLFALSDRWGTARKPLLFLAVIAFCLHDLRQHQVLFVQGHLYELVTEGLIRAQGIIR